ncbi:MAG: hexitol phosphatase HxpB [Bacteroidota bacterium]
MKQPNGPQAILFDMDGTLIDSEPFWAEGEQAVFGELGVTIDPELAKTTSGMTTEAVTEFWYQRQPWQGVSQQEVGERVIRYVGEKIKTEGQPIPGTHALLEFFHKQGLPIGLVTNSPGWLIPLVLDRLKISQFFQTLVSVDDVELGKPHPAIYQLGARQLGIEPEFCLAFEDSATGLRAAHGAGMKTVGIIPQSEWGWEKFSIADWKISTLAGFTNSLWAQIQNTY